MFDITGPALQALLFALFAVLTSILSGILGPTYDGLLVPQLSPAALYPGLSGGFLIGGTALSQYVVDQLVDPAIPLLALGVGVLYLARSVLPELHRRAQSLVPKLVISVLLANFSLPVAGAILGVAGGGYPVLAGYDGGAWQHWSYLAGPYFLRFSWDNGLLAFILSFVLFGLVLLLAIVVAVRDALLSVLLALLPLFSLVYAIPSLAPLTRKGWIMFGQLAFLPWVLVIPLELAVGCGSAILLVGYLTVAVAAPGLLSMAGAQLGSIAFPSAGSALSSGLQRGQASGTLGASALLGPVARNSSRPLEAPSAVRSAATTGISAPLPLSLPFFAGELVGHGLSRVFSHIPGVATSGDRSGDGPRFPGVRTRGRP